MRNFLFVGIAVFGVFSSGFAAQPMNLRHQSPSGFNSNQISLKQINSHTDFNHVTHIRLQQMYLGHPVWGADAVVHLPPGSATSLAQLASTHATMNGTLYQGLEHDLQNTPAFVLNASQSTRALNQAVLLYQKKSSMNQPATHGKSDLIVYVDHNNHAHWAYHVSFVLWPKQGIPALPHYILDAATFAVYAQWNDLETLYNTMGGGYGGNENLGRLTYDGLKDDLPKLNIERDALQKICYLQNAGVTVRDVFHDYQIASYPCPSLDIKHGLVYWNADHDAIHGAYSPENDALYDARIVQNMYQQWYGIPVMVDDHYQLLPLTLNVHFRDEQDFDLSFFWPDNMQVYFADGATLFYPLVSLGVVGHELSHGFTQQHSKLLYDYGADSAGLNESFSDMAAKAVEFYAYGQNTWEFAAEIMRAKGKALRYMDDPTKDCDTGQIPGENCSIDNIKDLKSDTEAHFSSGIFNKAFYLIATHPSWDTKKAFNIMVKANQDYWVPNTSFQEAACGVVDAAKDYQYDVTAVNDAMTKVGIDMGYC